MLVNRTVAWDSVEGADGYIVEMLYPSGSTRYNYEVVSKKTEVNLSLVSGNTVTVQIQAFVKVPHTNETIYGIKSTIIIQTPVMHLHAPENIRLK